MIKNLSIFFLLFFSLVSTSSAQEEQEDYSSEFVWGINKNTAGGLIGGVTFRRSRQIGDKLYESLGLELMNVKHPQESQLRTPNGSSFIFGKLNYLYALRFQYGRELILFRKAPQQGVEIKAVAAVGPSIGLLAPYYIEYSPDAGGGFGGNSVRVAYDPAVHSIDRVLGTGHLFQGVTQSNLRVGANLKAGLSFELGTIKSNVTGFELGALVDAYTQEIELVAGTEHKSIFPTAYITIFYGTRR